MTIVVPRPIGGDTIGKGKGGKGQSPNDQRSNALNRNNPAYAAAQDNRANQMNPTSDAYLKSRKNNEEKDE